MVSFGTVAWDGIVWQLVVAATKFWWEACPVLDMVCCYHPALLPSHAARLVQFGEEMVARGWLVPTRIKIGSHTHSSQLAQSWRFASQFETDKKAFIQNILLPQPQWLPLHYIWENQTTLLGQKVSGQYSGTETETIPHSPLLIRDQWSSSSSDKYLYDHLPYQRDECNSLIGGCGHLSETWRHVSESNLIVHTVHTVHIIQILLHTLYTAH